MKKNNSFSEFFKNIPIKSTFIPLILILLAIILIFADKFTQDKKVSAEITDTESRLCSMVNDLEGVSDAEVMLLFDSNGNVSGAAIICIGGDMAINQKKISDLFTSLFDLRYCDVFVGGK